MLVLRRLEEVIANGRYGGETDTVRTDGLQSSRRRNDGMIILSVFYNLAYILIALNVLFPCLKLN